MEEVSFSNIKQKNDIKNDIIIYRFVNALIYLIIFKDKIVSILKKRILLKEEKSNYLFFSEKTQNKLFCYENKFLLAKNEYFMNLIKKDIKNLNNNYNKTKLKQIKKRKNNNNYIKTTNRIFIIINLILFIIICLIKSNILFDLFSIQYSSKITLKIKGIGDSYILENDTNSKFTGLYYLKEVKINGIKQNKIEYKYYFNLEDNIVELIWDDNINNCNNLFRKCSNITEINLSDFNTSKVTSMSSMFYGCSSLTSINLSNLNTSKVKLMSSMFNRCSSLTSLDLSNFDTSQVTSMSSIFCECKSLSSLDISNFDTSQVTSMSFMFKGCPLTSLDLNHFDTSQVKDMHWMFCDCSSLSSLEISNFNTSQVTDMSIMFKGCSFTSLDLQNFDTSQVKNMYWMFCDCKSLTSLDLSNFDTSQVTNMDSMFSGCKNLEYINLNNFNEIVLDNADDMFYNIPKDFVICLKEINTESKILSKLDYGKKCYSIDCIDDLNSKQNKLTNNDDECNEKCDKSSQYKYKYNGKCYEHCPNGFLYDKINNKCIKKIFKNIIQGLISEKNDTEKMSKKEETEYYDNLINLIETEFIENYLSLNLDNGNDEVIKTEKMTMTLTSLQNQKININKNITIIDLGICENLLRHYYNLSKNETIYMKKIEVVQEGLKIPKIDYDVYSPLFGTNLKKLNLTVCGNNKISIFLPIKIDENLDKLNTSSGYYNDICYTTTSEDGTDITLKDRKKDFVDTNKTVCQEDCEFSKYNTEEMKVECSCNVKESSSSIADMNINKAQLLENFKAIKNIANLNILVCYKKLFKKDGIINNIGCYIMSGIIFFHLITIIVFYAKGFILLKKKINKLIFGNNKFQKRNQKEKIKKFELKIKSNKIIIYNKNKMGKTKSRNNIKNNIEQFKRINSKNKMISKINGNKKSFYEKINNQFEYIDEEINELSYNLALKYDKRNFCQYYFSLIKTKHNLFFAFFNCNDYNSGIIKIDLFFIGFAIEYTVNALFYHDDTMHKIYESKGQFDLETQLPIIVYSTLITMILNSPWNFLALSNDAIISLKQSDSNINIMKKVRRIKKALTIKFILYFLFSFLLLIFFWYYISMFCVIYKNTKIHLLKDTLMSFGLSLIIPFVIYLLPGIFRIPALSNIKNKRQCLYNFSKFFQSF